MKSPLIRQVEAKGLLISETGRIRFRRVRFQTPNSVSFSGLTEFRGVNSVSSSQPIICVPKRTHRVLAELAEFATELSEFSPPKQYSRNSIPPVSYDCSGKKKAHKHKRFGPVALGTTPSLSLGQTQFVPGTNRGFLLILHSGSPVCPWDKPVLSLGQTGGEWGQTGGEWRQKKFMCQIFMCLFWPLIVWMIVRS